MNELNNLRKRAGLSMDQLAKAMGLSGSSSIQRYLSDDYDDGFKPKMAARIRAALIAKGSPPIADGDLSILFAIPLTLADRITTVRERAGWSQTQLAAEVGVSRGAVAQWEVGKTEPSASNLREIAVKAAVGFDWLAIGRGNPPENIISGALSGAENVPARATLPLPEGTVTIEMPARLSDRSLERLSEWFELLTHLAEAPSPDGTTVYTGPDAEKSVR